MLLLNMTVTIIYNKIHSQSKNLHHSYLEDEYLKMLKIIPISFSHF